MLISQLKLVYTTYDYYESLAGCLSLWLPASVSGWMYGCLSVWVDGCMAGCLWMDGYIAGWLAVSRISEHIMDRF